MDLELLSNWMTTWTVLAVVAATIWYVARCSDNYLLKHLSEVKSATQRELERLQRIYEDTHAEWSACNVSLRNLLDAILDAPSGDLDADVSEARDTVAQWRTGDEEYKVLLFNLISVETYQQFDKREHRRLALEKLKEYRLQGELLAKIRQHYEEECARNKELAEDNARRGRIEAHLQAELREAQESLRRADQRAVESARVLDAANIKLKEAEEALKERREAYAEVSMKLSNTHSDLLKKTDDYQSLVDQLAAERSTYEKVSADLRETRKKVATTCCYALYNHTQALADSWQRLLDSLAAEYRSSLEAKCTLYKKLDTYTKLKEEHARYVEVNKDYGSLLVELGVITEDELQQMGILSGLLPTALSIYGACRSLTNKQQAEKTEIIKDLTAQVEQQRRLTSERGGRVDALEYNAQQLNAQLSDTRHQLAVLQGEVTEREQGLAAREAELEAEVGQLMGKLNEVTAQSEEYWRERKEYQSECESLEKQLVEVQLDLGTMTLERDKAKHGWQESHKAYEKSSELYGQADLTIAQLRDEQETLQTQLADTTDSYKLLSGSYNKLCNDLSDLLSALLPDHPQTVPAAKRRVEDLQAQLVKAVEERDIVQNYLQRITTAVLVPESNQSVESVLAVVERLKEDRDRLEKVRQALGADDCVL